MYRTSRLCALVLGLAIVGCSGESFTSVDLTDAPVAREGVTSASGSATPTLLTPIIRGCDGPLTSCKKHDGEVGFSSPLFGLATAPNGDVLVADAGAGILTAEGVLQVSLPGVSAVAPIGRNALWATIGGFGAEPSQALVRATPGHIRQVADLWAFEMANNPDGAQIDSNPYDVAAVGGEWALVADAAANALLRVDDEGHVDVVAVFPMEVVSTDNIKAVAGCPGSGGPLCGLPSTLAAEPVPTSVAIAPDGTIYVGELKGFPSPTGVSNVWRIAPGATNAVCGSSPDCEKVFDGGFTSIIDLTFGADGTLYVAEMDESGWIAVELESGAVGGTVNACDLGSGTCTEIATGIPILTAVTEGRDGGLWATTNALIPGSAGVIPIP